MNKYELDAFQVVGISTRTTNANGQAKKDIGELWQRFMSEKISDQLPLANDPSIYAVYTDYEGDHTKPYTLILGHKVSSEETVPSGMVSKKIEKANYRKFTAKGNLMGEAVIGKWLEIWEMDLNRTYTTDLEVYGEKAADPSNGEADIYIAIK